MRSQVRFIPQFRCSRRNLGLKPIDQRTIRWLLAFNPLIGKRLYKPICALGRYPNAGLYEWVFENRNSFGFPHHLKCIYFLLDTYSPIYGIQLFGEHQEDFHRLLTMTDLRLIEQLADNMITAFGDPA